MSIHSMLMTEQYLNRTRLECKVGFDEPFTGIAHSHLNRTRLECKVFYLVGNYLVNNI